ncbi:MAG: ribonuclease R [Candidatus Cloacimonadota bacterium]|nr:MAG: ribonuclease R [Candidatus Cloacimonadota bacterium]
MYDRKLAGRIKSLLKESAGKIYSVNKLAKRLKIKKHKKNDFEDTLKTLVSEKKIFSSGKRYFYENKKTEELLSGTFDATSLAKNYSFAFVKIDGKDFDVFVSAENTMNAFHKDKVKVEIRNINSTKKYGIIRSVEKRYTDEFVGNISSYKNTEIFEPDLKKIHKNFTVLNPDKNLVGKKVVLKIKNWGNANLNLSPAGEVVEIIGDSGESNTEIQGVIRQFNLPLNFPEDVLKETLNLPTEIPESEISSRTDLRDIETFTIDPVSAKDYDDAISLVETENGWKLYVHIADVSFFVKPGSRLFEESSIRGNSFYFPKKVIPMLPFKISNNLCSLRPFEDKLTVSVITDFDKDFNQISQTVCESIINSDARLTYEDVDLLFEGKDAPIDYSVRNTLLIMRKLSDKLSERRTAAGALYFNLHDTDYIYDDDGKLKEIVRTPETASHKLIENFMLLANEFIAKRLTKLAKTTLYRIHENPDPEEIEKAVKLLRSYEISVKKSKDLNKTFQNILDAVPNNDFHRVFDKILLRKMKKAKYSTRRIRHFGLGMELYTHFTSPIRRFCDLIIHHQIKTFLTKSSKIKFSAEELGKYAYAISDRELIADEAEREVNKKFIISYMKNFSGEIFTGLIVGMNSSSLFIEPDKIPVTGVLKISELDDDYYTFYDKAYNMVGKKKGRVFRLADRVTVQVVSVVDDVYFRLYEEEDNEKKI